MSDLSGKRVLVTGAGGFIGSHLTEALLRAGASVRAFVHYNSRNDSGLLRPLESSLDQEAKGRLEIVAGDITDAFGVDRAVEGCEVVFHLAALIGIPYSYRAPASYVAVNISGTLNVLESCRRHGVKRLVQTSTSEVYGSAQYTPIDESHPLVGQSPYAASKIASDQLALSYWRSFETPVVVVRPFNAFGPGQSLRAVVPTIVAQVAASEAAGGTGAIRLSLGSLDTIRDLTYVSDTAAGFLAAAEGSDETLGEVFNLGTGRGESVARVVELAGELAGRELVVEQDPARRRPEKSEVMELIASSAKAKTLLGWEPRLSLEEGLERYLAWMRDQPPVHLAENYTV